jgi:MFS family permease
MGHAAIAALPAISAEARKRSVRDIFAPGLIGTTVLSALAYFFHIITFYFLLKWIPKIVVDMHFTPSEGAGVVIWANVGGALGGTVFGLLSQRVGLKPLTIGVMLLSAVMVVLFGRTAPNLTELSLLCAAAGFCTNAAIVGLYAIFAQAFPTHVRATGTGFAIGVGRGGSVLAPITAGYLFKWGYSLPTVAVYMAMGSLVAAGVLALLKLKPDQPASITLLSRARS